MKLKWTGPRDMWYIPSIKNTGGAWEEYDSPIECLNDEDDPNGYYSRGAIGKDGDRFWINVDGDRDILFSDSLEEAKAILTTMVKLAGERNAA